MWHKSHIHLIFDSCTEDQQEAVHIDSEEHYLSYANIKTECQSEHQIEGRSKEQLNRQK